MINEKLRLSVGAPPVARTVGVLAGLVFAGVGAAVAALPYVAEGLVRDLTGATPACAVSGDVSDIPPELLPPEFQCAAGGFWHDGLGPYRLLALIGVPFALLGCYMVLATLRRAAWLDGTTLLLRGALGTRAVDLATADVTAGVVTHRTVEESGRARVRRVPTLVARDRGTGKQLTLPLEGRLGMDTLPPYELRALADAMTAGRATAGRDADVHVVATQLRAMADNPLALS